MTSNEINRVVVVRRYHNCRFKAPAEELGLEIHEESGIGWSGTVLPEETRLDYQAVIRPSPWGPEAVLPLVTAPGAGGLLGA